MENGSFMISQPSSPDLLRNLFVPLSYEACYQCFLIGRAVTKPSAAPRERNQLKHRQKDKTTALGRLLQRDGAEPKKKEALGLTPKLQKYISEPKIENKKK